jgi:hypothetical protein
MMECTRVIRGYHLGIKDVFKKYHPCGNVYKVMKGDEPTCCALHNGDDNFDSGLVTETASLIQNWVEQIPGYKSSCDYGDFYCEFEMNDVTDSGLTTDQLECILQEIANAINRNRNLEAHEEPYRYESTDAWGAKSTYWRFPALKPLVGMPGKDYPNEIMVF